MPESPPASRSSSRLIADGDSVARNAFRVALRTDTPIPTASVTQELDPSDILEVQDMAEAIARAEKMVAAPRSSRIGDVGAQAPVSGPSLADMFEALGHRPQHAPARATDDAVGPATPAPPPGIPTPVPPRFVTMPSALPALTAPTPSSAVEDDAYYQPAGRMRSLADVTLDGYRPEPTLLVRAAGRRKRFAGVFVAALLPLLVLAAIAVFASADEGAIASSGVASIDHARSAPSVPAPGKTPIATTSATSKVAPAAVDVAAAAAAITGPAAWRTAGAPPVFDVNSLPSASVDPKR